jgi:hypothetical protein
MMKEGPTDRPRHNRVDRTPLDFFIDQADADENRDDDADQIDGR